jgi:hypothetical protein
MVRVNRFFFPATTNTHADVLAAVGLADLLRSAGDCVIHQTGGGLEVLLDSPLDLAAGTELDLSPGYLFLKPNAKTTVPKGMEDVLDYAAEKAKVKAYSAARQAAKAIGGEVAEEVAANAPRKDWRLYQVLNTLQGDEMTNGIIMAIRKLGTAQWRVQLHTAVAALHENSAAEVCWKVSLVQLFSPHAGKGKARLKPGSTSRGDKTKDGWADPFTEWLRVRGYFAAACPFFTGSKGENIRMLCPVPKKIEAGALVDVVAQLRQAGIYGSGPKIDCLATLELARLLIRHFQEHKLKLLAPVDVISGVMIANYQSMGQARSVTTLETLAVPGWFPLRTEADADLWTATLEEHRAVIHSMRDNHSDEIGLILAYRRFLQQRGLTAAFALLEFVGQYGIFVLRERARDPKCRRKQFQTNHLEAIVNQQEDYKQIIGNAGFQAVAAAIRSATVSAQSMKKSKKDHREIRYDLLPELSRKRSLPGVGPFLEAVSDFIATYNKESARRLEQNKRSGIKRISSEDMESFTQLLLEQKNAAVLGAMLCAYATCKAPKEADEPEAPTIDEPEPQPEDDNEGDQE